MSNCEHPFDKVAWIDERTDRQLQTRVPSHVRCTECNLDYNWQINAEDFVQYRSGLFAAQTGEDPTPHRDMLYRVIETGSLVVYPAMSGRSAQIVLGEVVDIDMNRKRGPLSPDELARIQSRSHHGAPYSIKIQPMGSSRWKQHWGTRWTKSGTINTGIKPVTLWANAPSVVVVGDV